MKSNSKYITVFIFTYLALTGFSQTLNWNDSNKQYKHFINAHAGADYSVIYGLGYGYQLSTKIPIVLNCEFSVPAGGEGVFDDFKTKIGGQVKLFSFKNFTFSSKINGVIRRYENPNVRLFNFGSDISGAAGYYRPKWFVAAEVGFDKAIVTNFKHSRDMKNSFPTIVDGWYEPATGGNFYYGIQTGFSIKKHDVYFKLGKVITQDFKTKPFIPYYAQLGYNFKIGK